MNPNVAGASPVEQPAPSLRRRKRDERRDRVYVAAVTLFVEQGFDDTSMDDIAERSGLSRTTVFNHFPRKAAFLEEWSRRRRQRAARSFDMPDASQRPLHELLGGYFATLAVLNVETRVETSALMSISLQQSDALLGHTLGDDLADLVTASGTRLRRSADPRQIGRLLALGYYSAVVRWIHVEPAPFDLGDELSNLVETVLSGALAN